MNISRLLVVTTMLGFLVFNGCKKQEQTAQYPNAESNGIDDQALFSAIEKARDDKGILSMIVFRNDDIIAEEYFGNNNRENIHPIRSVTKSVTSVLYGLAKDKGLIKDLDITVGDCLSEYLSSSDSLVSKITIKQLLTMSGGFKWEEQLNYDDYNNWVHSTDHLVHALQVPVIHTPGTHFTYTTPGCQILSAIFTKKTGLSLKLFAKTILYPQLEIEGDRPWEQDQHGYNYGGVASGLKAIDMLKIGILMRDQGKYNGRQILSESWINESTNVQFDVPDAYNASEYGYLWWIGEKNNIDYFFASGYGGQFIFVFPDLRLVVVAQSEISNVYRSSNEQWMNTATIILTDILNSVS